jgi:protein TonB
MFDVGIDLNAELPDPIEPIKIPPTKQPDKLPKPERPRIPVATEEDEMLNAVDIDFIDMQENWFIDDPGQPTDTTIEEYEFFAISDKPVLVKKVNPVYPELARKAQVEGIVVVKVLISTKGNIEDVKIMKSIPMLDNAALEAARMFKFTPGKQRDRLVKVWMQIPFKFQIR